MTVEKVSPAVMRAIRREEFEERAAIIEFCSGKTITRKQAEEISAALMDLSEDEVEFLMGANP
jgi:hypothetical protein